jgi:hypothetical protein
MQQHQHEEFIRFLNDVERTDPVKMGRNAYFSIQRRRLLSGGLAGPADGAVKLSWLATDPSLSSSRPQINACAGAP